MLLMDKFTSPGGFRHPDRRVSDESPTRSFQAWPKHHRAEYNRIRHRPSEEYAHPEKRRKLNGTSPTARPATIYQHEEGREGNQRGVSPRERVGSFSSTHNQRPSYRVSLRPGNLPELRHRSDNDERASSAGNSPRLEYVPVLDPRPHSHHFSDTYHRAHSSHTLPSYSRGPAGRDNPYILKWNAGSTPHRTSAVRSPIGTSLPPREYRRAVEYHPLSTHPHYYFNPANPEDGPGSKSSSGNTSPETPESPHQYRYGDARKESDPRGNRHYERTDRPSPSQSQASTDRDEPQRWVCDYCHTAEFSTYEEAAAHEDSCKGQPSKHEGRREFSPRYSPCAIPHSDGPYLPANRYQVQSPNASLPSIRGSSPRDVHSYHRGFVATRPSRPSPSPSRKSIFLASPDDKDCLSDRQCYVRSKFVEVFAATDEDVASRHSRGAQRLFLGQVGLRCVFCMHLKPRARAERAVCYPSSISRIYQTVADMQRFHFEVCQEIPQEIRKTYKSLKTTRPRGVGSPQTYWIKSAKEMDLVDSDKGIKFGTNALTQQGQRDASNVNASRTVIKYSPRKTGNRLTASDNFAPGRTSDDVHIHSDEASMLLSLRKKV